MLMPLSILCYLASFAHGLALWPSSNNEGPWELNIVHVNDIHAHFEEMNEFGGRCNQEEDKAGQCYGGQARLLNKARQLKALDPNHTLFLNAGDYYTGSAIFVEYGYKAIIEFSNMMGYDAMSIGNHDFDKEISGLASYLDQANYDFLATNLDRDKAPALNKTKNSVIKTVDGHKVGIIGYISSKTPGMSNSNLTQVEFLPEIASVKKEAKRLKEDHNVSIIIALGHSGYDVDLELAKRVPELDVVVGGHSHTFLWTGDNPPALEKPHGPYPTYVTQEGSSKVVPVVQAYCYSKYIGYFKLRFNTDGELLTPVDGVGVTQATPYLIDRNTEADQEVVQMIAKYRANMTAYSEPVGSTMNLLCVRSDIEESNLGDVIADSMVDAWRNQTEGPIIALENNGGIRATIAQGHVVYEDLINVMPFGNTLDRGKILGSDLRQVFENVLYGLVDENSREDSFFQISGLRIKALVTDDNAGHRITEMKVRCGDGLDSEDWCEFHNDKEYWIVLPSYMSTGGGATEVGLDKVLKDLETGPTDITAFKSYFKSHSPLSGKLDGRIDIQFQKKTNNSGRSINSITYLSLIVSSVVILATHTFRF